MTFNEWIQIGEKAGWIGPPVCAIHDGLPVTADEDEALFEGDEPCVHVARLYESDDVRDAVEAHHAPSRWRKHF